MPTPTAPSTSLSSIFPIDISVIVIARSSRRADVVVANDHAREMGDDPLEAAGDRAALDEARRLVEAERDVDSLDEGGRKRADHAVADLDLAAADVDPVQLGALDEDAVELDTVGAVDLDAVLAAATMRSRTVTSSAVITIPPRTTAPSSPTSV